MQSVQVTGATRVDALFVGTVFLDIVLSGLAAEPAPGQEVWAARRSLTPGGMANNAVGAARLGLRTALVTALGDDLFGDAVWAALTAEAGLDLSWSTRTTGLETALSVVVSNEHDRTIISHGQLDPVPLDQITRTLPLAAASFFSLRPYAVEWITRQKRAGSIVFAGLGWEGRRGEAGSQLTDVNVLVMNESEAIAYTGADDARGALLLLGESVPLAVITRGGSGALALDSVTGIEADVPTVALPGPVRDTTGAGDEFVAALMHATLAGFQLADRLRYANLCAGLAVRAFGGSASAPTLLEVEAWYRSAGPHRAEYEFLEELFDARSSPWRASPSDLSVPIAPPHHQENQQ